MGECGLCKYRGASFNTTLFIVVYYKSRKREVKAKLMNESVR